MKRTHFTATLQRRLRNKPSKKTFIKTTDHFMRLIIAILVIVTAAVQPVFGVNYLFADGKSEYVIVVDDNASKSEIVSAEELKDYIFQISGATLPIVKSAPTNKYIYVGWTAMTGHDCPADANEGYTYLTIDDNLYIFGGRLRGIPTAPSLILSIVCKSRRYTCVFLTLRPTAIPMSQNQKPPSNFKSQ